MDTGNVLREGWARPRKAWLDLSLIKGWARPASLIKTWLDLSLIKGRVTMTMTLSLRLRTMS